MLSPEAEAVDVQLLGQVTSAESGRSCSPTGSGAILPAWRAGRVALTPAPTHSTSGRFRRVASVARQDSARDVRKRQPKKMLSAPGLTVFDPEKSASDATTALAVVCATWLEDVGMSDFQALRLAPPVLETWATGGRLLSRAVVDFGLEWSLPAADGV